MLFIFFFFFSDICIEGDGKDYGGITLHKHGRLKLDQSKDNQSQSESYVASVSSSKYLQSPEAHPNCALHHPTPTASMPDLSGRGDISPPFAMNLKGLVES